MAFKFYKEELRGLYMHILSYEELVNKTKQFVVGQDAAVEKMCLIVYKHLIRNWALYDLKIKNTETNTTLLIGDTGTGKTFIIKTICDLIGLPFLIIDGSDLSQGSGWHGTDLSTHIEKHLKESTHHLKHISIIFIDEFDKLCSPKSSSTKDNTSIGVQSNMLTIFEDSVFGSILVGTEEINDNGVITYKDIKKDISSNNFLFLLAGAFVGLDVPPTKRSGFVTHIEDNETLDSKLIKFGMLPEILGRIAEIIVLRKLIKEDLIAILNNENSGFQTWAYTLNLFGININKTLVNEIAEKALQNNTGARSLKKYIHEVLDSKLLENKENLDIEKLDNEYKKRNELGGLI